MYIAIAGIILAFVPDTLEVILALPRWIFAALLGIGLLSTAVWLLMEK